MPDGIDLLQRNYCSLEAKRANYRFKLAYSIEAIIDDAQASTEGAKPTKERGAIPTLGGGQTLPDQAGPPVFTLTGQCPGTIVVLC